MSYVVGIDPQITLLAVRIDFRDKAGGWQKVAWFQVLMKRKDAYVIVAEWEKYMVDQCIRTVDEIEGLIETHHGSDKGYRVEFGVEQQRGRVKSIPEACLITAAKAKGWNIHVPHPSSWKKAISFYKKEKLEDKKKGHVTGNKDNKKRAEELYGKELRDFCTDKKIPTPKIIHHLCDAACIARYLQSLSIEDKTKE